MSARVAFSASLTRTPPIPTEEATLHGGLCHLLADAAQPGLEGIRVARCLGIDDGRDLPQKFERAPNEFSWLGTGKLLAQRLLNGGSPFRRLEISDDALTSSLEAESSFAASNADLLAKASLSVPHKPLGFGGRHRHTSHHRTFQDLGPLLWREVPFVRHGNLLALY